MPKVDKIQRTWLGTWTTFEIWFNKKKGFFVKDCPVEIIKYNQFFTNGEATLSDLKNKFITSLIHAEDVLTKSELVILIKFSITSDLYTSVTDQNKSSYTVDRDHPLAKFLDTGFRSMDGIGMAIDYRIAKKIIRGNEIEYYSRGSEVIRSHTGKLYVKDGEVEVPFSEEREKTLLTIQSKMIEMVKNLAWFFSVKPEVMANTLQSGNLKSIMPG